MQREHAAMRDGEGAVGLYEEVLEHDGKNRRALEGLCELTSEAGQYPRARASGRRRVLWRRVQRALDGSRRLCGGSREVWEGCRRFWKGSVEVLGGLGAQLKGENGSTVGGFQVP